MSAEPPRPLKVIRGRDAPPPRPVHWILPKLLAKGAGTILFGQPGVAKSVQALHLCACVTLGLPFLHFGRPERPMRVLYLDFDGGWEWIHDTVRGVYRSYGVEELPFEFMYYSPLSAECRHHDEPEDSLVALEDLGPSLERTVREYGIDLVVADSLGQMMVGDSNSAQDVSIALRVAFNPARAVGAAVLVIDHSAKAAAGALAVPTPSGSQQKRAWARVTVALEQDSLDEAERATKWTVDKSNAAHFAPFLTRLNFIVDQTERLREVRLEHLGDAPAKSLERRTIRDAMGEVILQVLESGPASRADLPSGSTADRALTELIGRGLIQRGARGRYELASPPASRQSPGDEVMRRGED